MIDHKLPEVSVVIPTYNRARELERTLRSLTCQDLPADRYEVIVADDGSTDDTRAVVEACAKAFPVGYVHQEDLGFRAGQARNLGAAQARGRILVFLDCGMIAPRHLVSGHLAAHEGGGRAVIGYIFGYDFDPAGQVRPEELEDDPDEMIERFSRTGRHLDMREPSYRSLGELDKCAAPWVFFWTGNVSVAAEDFWAVGGFDPDFVGWSGEDLELGLRLHTRGLTFTVARGAPSIEVPHPRDVSALRPGYEKNARLTLSKHIDPLVEVATVCWPDELHPRLDELGAATRERLRLARERLAGRTPSTPVRPAPRTVLFGADCLSSVPYGDPGATLCVEPDPGLAEEARARVPGIGILPLHGFRTLLEPASFDLCLLSPSLLAYPGWAVYFLQNEATSIARRIQWLDVPGSEEREER